jgi:Mor family transcriptional regulator
MTNDEAIDMMSLSVIMSSMLKGILKEVSKLSMAAALLLEERYGGGYVYIPLIRQKETGILADIKKGVSLPRVAKKYRVSLRTIYNYRRRAGLN